MFSNLTFSPFLRGKSHGQKIAFLGVLTAINVVFNSFFEFRTLDVQFSFTILVSILTGIISGGFSGFFVCVLADFIGYLINSFGFLYMPWVGLSTGVLALFAGLIFYKDSKKYLLKGIIICIFSLIVCTVLINSTGFYFYNKIMGFSTAVLSYVNSVFGKNVSYIAYVSYRLMFKGQIYNNIFNYALLFVVLPVFKKIKILK